MKQKFLDAKLTSSTENKLEFYTDLYQTFQGIYENKLEELVNKFNMNSEQFYNGLSRRCDEGDQEVILFVDIINEMAPKVRSQFTIDTLNYLHKGGRCSGASKLFGTLLNPTTNKW